MRRQLLLAAVWWAGCGGDDAPPAPMAKPGAVEATAARVVVGEDDGRWIDVVVEGTDAAAREACESLVNAEVRTAGAPGDARIARPCAASALPATAGGGHVLVDARTLDATDALLAGRAARDATVTSSTRFADLAACEEARRLLAEIASRDHVSGARSERRFLRDQLERAEREETARCAEVVDGEVDCAARVAEAPAAERPYVENQCRIERDHQRRNCASARAEVASLRTRIAEPEPSAPVVTPGECRAE